MANTNNTMSLADDKDEYHCALDESLNLASINAEGTKKRMLEQANECRKKAKQIRAEAMRLEQEAEQMDVEERRFRNNSHDASALCNSLQYESLLVRLTRNDKDTTVVDARNFPLGHGKALGEALRLNTMVTKLDLELSTFFVAQDSEHLAKQEMGPFLQFLQGNTSLVSFGVSHDPMTPADSVIYKMSDMLFEFILKLQQLERLSWDRPVTAAYLRRMMKSFKVLRELEVELGDDDDTPSTDNNEQAVLSGFRACPMLRKLKLVVVDDIELNAQILPRLWEVSALEELCLKTGYEDDALINALSTYLQVTSALQRLELDSFDMHDSEMEQLVAALQRTPNSRPDGLHTVLITALSFRTCAIDREACKRLTSFLQIKTVNETLSKSTFNSGLRELHVSAQDGENEQVVTGRMGRFLSRKLAVSILKARTERAQESDADGGLLLGNSRPLLIPTIGSQIVTLSLMWVHSCFFNHLRDNADRVGCLQNLELVGMTKVASKAFSKCMPKLRSLRSLKVLPMLEQDPAILDWVLCGLLHNQSILTVTTSDDDTKTEFSDCQLRLMDAYCQRNQFLTKLLASDSRRREVDSSQHGAHAMSTNDGTAALCIRPELLGSAYHITDDRSTLFTQGLLALGRTIGDDEPTDPSRHRDDIGADAADVADSALWSMTTSVLSTLHSFFVGTPH